MYPLKDENGKISGVTRWPNQQTSTKIDEQSQEWIDYLNNELASAEREWRDGELERADIEVFKTEDTLGAFDAEPWRSYRLLLRAWPDSPDFPDSTKRPIAPDAI